MERAQTAREHVRAEPPHRGVARETVTLSVEGREVQVEVVRQPRHLGGSQAYWRCPKCEALDLTCTWPATNWRAAVAISSTIGRDTSCTRR